MSLEVLYDAHDHVLVRVQLAPGEHIIWSCKHRGLNEIGSIMLSMMSVLCSMAMLIASVSPSLNPSHGLNILLVLSVIPIFVIVMLNILAQRPPPLRWKKLAADNLIRLKENVNNQTICDIPNDRTDPFIIDFSGSIISREKTVTIIANKSYHEFTMNKNQFLQVLDKLISFHQLIED